VGSCEYSRAIFESIEHRTYLDQWDQYQLLKKGPDPRAARNTSAGRGLRTPVVCEESKL
jgi:hypothetical protein